MSVYPVNFGSMLDQLTTDPPAIDFDVKYEIVNNKGEVEGEVEAHKFHLALASPVFRAGFCGADFTEKKSKIIRKEDTTLKAFTTMINFMYKKPISFEEMTIEELFDVLDLGHYYELSELEELMKQQLAAFKVTKDTVLEVATVAEQFKKFEDASAALYDNCAKMLNKEIGNDFQSLLSFCSQLSVGEEARAVVGLKLLSAVEKLLALAGQNKEVLEKEREAVWLAGWLAGKLAKIRSEIDIVMGRRLPAALVPDALERLAERCNKLKEETFQLRHSGTQWYGVYRFMLLEIRGQQDRIEFVFENGV